MIIKCIDTNSMCYIQGFRDINIISGFFVTTYDPNLLIRLLQCNSPLPSCPRSTQWTLTHDALGPIIKLLIGHFKMVTPKAHSLFLINWYVSEERGAYLLTLVSKEDRGPFYLKEGKEYPLTGAADDATPTLSEGESMLLHL
jgi:hypothetical protein